MRSLKYFQPLNAITKMFKQMKLHNALPFAFKYIVSHDVSSSESECVERFELSQLITLTKTQCNIGNKTLSALKEMIFTDQYWKSYMKPARPIFQKNKPAS